MHPWCYVICRILLLYKVCYLWCLLLDADLPPRADGLFEECLHLDLQLAVSGRYHWVDQSGLVDWSNDYPVTHPTYRLFGRCRHALSCDFGPDWLTNSIAHILLDHFHLFWDRGNDSYRYHSMWHWQGSASVKTQKGRRYYRWDFGRIRRFRRHFRSSATRPCIELGRLDWNFSHVQFGSSVCHISRDSLHNIWNTQEL